jgi:hypothetical protein
MNKLKANDTYSEIDSEMIKPLGIFRKLLYCLTSQMWLIPLVDDRQSTHLTKLKKKTPLVIPV